MCFTHATPRAAEGSHCQAGIRRRYLLTNICCILWHVTTFAEFKTASKVLICAFPDGFTIASNYTRLP